MLHLELRVPSDLTERVTTLLSDDPTVTNVAVLPHAFVEPRGCLVQADVARESASAVLGQLKELGLAHDGSISLRPLETILSDEAVRAEKAAPGAPDDGVVWDAVEQRLRGESRVTGAFLAFMTLAALIAGAGRILDQPILIVGAMVVGPEFSPIAAICFALARPRPSMLPQAALSLVSGFGTAVVAATAVWAVVYAFDGFDRVQAATGRSTEFIVSPDAWSFAVACLAGIAGTLSLTTGRAGALVGVFISVTTIPAVGTAAVCIAAGVWSEVGSSVAQLGLNVAGLVLAGTVTLLVQRVIWARVGISTSTARAVTAASAARRAAPRAGTRAAR